MIALDIHPNLTVGELMKQLEKANVDSHVALWEYLNDIYKNREDCFGRPAEPHFRLPIK